MTKNTDGTITISKDELMYIQSGILASMTIAGHIVGPFMKDRLVEMAARMVCALFNEDE